jgi:hypothetical protein
MNYVVAFLLTLMRFAWLWPWLLLLRSFLSPSYQNHLLAPWMLIVIPLASLATVRWASAAPPPAIDPAAKGPAPEPTGLTWRMRFAAAGFGIVAILALLWWHYYRQYLILNPTWLYQLGYTLTHWGLVEVPPQAVSLFLLMILWLNGIGDAIRGLTHDDVWGALVRNVAALVLFVIIMAVAQRPLPDELFYLILLLFGAGMLALAFSSLKITVGLDRALGMGQRRISATPRLNRYWLSTVLITVVGLLGLGIGIVVLLAPEQLQRLIDAVGAVLNVIGWLFQMLLLALSYVAFAIVYLLYRLLEPLLQRIMERVAESPLADMLPAQEEMEQLQEVAQGNAPMPEAYRWIGLAIAIGLVILIFALALRRLQRETIVEDEETRESILTADLLQEQLSGLWNRWFGRRRGAHEPFMSLEGESGGRRQIRAIYQRLLADAATLGTARTPAETPDEYADHLQRARQTQAAALAALTDGYQQARYAPDEPDATQIAAVATAWEELAPTFRNSADDTARS